MRFVYDGTVPGAVERPNQLVVAWLPDDNPEVAWGDGEVGHGYGVWQVTGASSALASGFVYLRAGALLQPGFETGATWGRALLHELGHVVGLGHSADPADVMFPVIDGGPARFSQGDRERLWAAGDRDGCA